VALAVLALSSVLALSGVALTALTLGARPAVAAEPCVGVLVDARLLGGSVSTGCAQGDPDSGLEALTLAGYSYAFVPRQPGLVCQINGDPECSATSTDTYWSYWYRAKGSSTWVYASRGAGSHDPAPGSTEAWVWQDGGRREPPDIALRTICPQVASSPAPTRAARTSSPPSPDPTRTAGRSPSARRSSSTEAGAAASGRTSGKPSAGATTTAAPSSTTPAPTTTSRSGSPVSVPASPAARDASDDDSGALRWVGVAASAALIAVLGGSAVARSRRGGGP
jgi:hypothetical protein